MSVHHVNGWVACCDGCGMLISDFGPTDGTLVAEVYTSREEAEEGLGHAEGFMFVEPVVCIPCAAQNPDAMASMEKAADYFRAEFMVRDEDGGRE